MKYRHGKKLTHLKNEINLKGNMSVSTEVTETCTTVIERIFCQNSGKRGRGVSIHAKASIFMGVGGSPKNNKWSRCNE